ncbi:MAG: hypothetical protein LBL46_04330 [Rickettsiales bacterium]|jgi:hypothetical protein|nr:hypothetical protein [Rickettsiales bacterium]
MRIAFISADSVEASIERFVAPDLRAAAAETYEREMNPQTGEISMSGLYKVCAAAGWNAADDAGFGHCREFVDSMMLGRMRPGIVEKSVRESTAKYLNAGANPGPECWAEDVWLNFICDADGRAKDWGAGGADFAAGRISAAEQGTDEWRTRLRLRQTKDEAMHGLETTQQLRNDNNLRPITAPVGARPNFEVVMPTATASTRG